MIKKATRTRWCRLWKNAGLLTDPMRWFYELEARYAEEHRHYHTLNHIDHCLHVFDAFNGTLSPRGRIPVEFTLWFHDSIYDPVSPLNEAKSAELAKTALWADGGQRVLAEEVHELTLTTRHEVPARAIRAKWVCDLDLASLGLPWKEFTFNTRRIRKEYSVVPDSLFYPGRLKFLTGFLGRPQLYQLPLFRRRFEEQARSNLEREIASIARRGFSTAGTRG